MSQSSSASEDPPGAPTTSVPDDSPAPPTTGVADDSPGAPTTGAADDSPGALVIGAADDGPGALVTGGTRGIGRVIAERLAAAGYRVLVCGRREPADLPPGVAFHRADVREPEEAAGLVAAAVEALGRLDLAVNNAGGSPPAPAATASPNLVTAIVRLNLLAPFFVAQAANAVMQGQPGGGLIVNIGSVSALRPAPGTAAYAAAKGGLEVLTRALALEWAPKVRVNTVTAGAVRTEDNAAHYGDEAALAAVAATVPLGRLATPEDVADAVLLLASPLAAYITGTSLVVDGGGQLPRYAETARPIRSGPQAPAQTG